MIPLSDNIPCRTTPYGNYLVIALCTVVFCVQLRDNSDPSLPTLVERYGLIPARITDPEKPIEIPVREGYLRTPFGMQPVIETRPAVSSDVPAILTLLTCVFLHGGWLHFLGNMWFLHIFGDNVEDRFGHIGFLIFYVAGGVAASTIHLLSEPGSTVPTIGASGAIAAVMGAYFVWYPHALIRALIPIFFFFTVMVVPAALFLAVWFVMQFFQGTASILSTRAEGVAWWAHVGGFGAGYLIAGLLGRTPAVHSRNGSVRSDSSEVGMYRFRAR